MPKYEHRGLNVRIWKAPSDLYCYEISDPGEGRTLAAEFGLQNFTVAFRRAFEVADGFAEDME